MKNYATADSPQTSGDWRTRTFEERLKLIDSVCNSGQRFRLVKASRALPDGNVFVNLVEALPPHIRGTLLLDLEAELKQQIDPGIVVWCEPLGDKSTLRNLRGIEIRTERVAEPRR